MKTLEEITKMAQAKALLAYPDPEKESYHFEKFNRIQRMANRNAYAQAIVDTYKESEMVNKKMLSALKYCMSLNDVWLKEPEYISLRLIPPYTILSEMESVLMVAIESAEHMILKEKQ